MSLLVCDSTLALIGLPALRVLRQEQESRVPAWLALPMLIIGLLLINLFLLQDSRLVFGLLGGVIALIQPWLNGLFIITVITEGVTGTGPAFIWPFNAGSSNHWILHRAQWHGFVVVITRCGDRCPRCRNGRGFQTFCLPMP